MRKRTSKVGSRLTEVGDGHDRALRLRLGNADVPSLNVTKMQRGKRVAYKSVTSDTEQPAREKSPARDLQPKYGSQ